MGLQPGREKEKLYTKDLTDLTLAKVVEMAENLSCAHAAAAASAAAPTQTSTPDQQLFKITNSDKSASIAKVKCSVCGYTNHKSAECKYANYVCKKCHVKGHLRRMCTKVVNYVQVQDGGKGEDDDDGKVYYIRSLRGEPMVETIYINSVPFQFEIDSGSAVTVVSENFYKGHFKDVPLSHTTFVIY